MNIKPILLILAAFAANLATGSVSQAQQSVQAQISMSDWLYDYDVYLYDWVTRYEVTIHWNDGSTSVSYSYSRDSAEDYVLFLYRTSLDVSYIEPIRQVTVRGNYEFYGRFPTYYDASLAVAYLSDIGEHAEIRSVRVNSMPTRQTLPRR